MGHRHERGVVPPRRLQERRVSIMPRVGRQVACPFSRSHIDALGGHAKAPGESRDGGAFVIGLGSKSMVDGNENRRGSPQSPTMSKRRERHRQRIRVRSAAAPDDDPRRRIAQRNPAPFDEPLTDARRERLPRNRAA